MPDLKAYMVTDKDWNCGYFLIVFAQSRGKAISEALGMDEFPVCDFGYVDLRANRKPRLDKYYRGRSVMDWFDDDDRVAMVKELDIGCGEDAFDPDDCEVCAAKNICSQYRDYLLEEAGVDRFDYVEKILKEGENDLFRSD